MTLAPDTVVLALKGGLYSQVVAISLADQVSMPSPSSATSVAPKTMRALNALMLALLVCASCQPVEQGFWTKPGMTDPGVSPEYRRDSLECAREGIEQVTEDKAPAGDTILTRHPTESQAGSHLYGKCMVARGYEWVKLQPLAGPSPHGQAAKQAPCPTERVILDPYGYPHCVTINTRPSAGPDHGPRETLLPKTGPAGSTAPSDTVGPKGSVSRDHVPLAPDPHTRPAGASDDEPASHGRMSAERQAYDNSLCIQYSQKSLSNPYETYQRCMTEKGWPTSPR